MLEKIDLDKKMKRKEWKELRPGLQNRLYDLEKAAYDAGMPVIILFEGWDAAGKGTCIRLLTQRLDPRGFKVWPIRAARTFEKNRPWLWRFWQKLPGHGEMAIFDHSWYGRVLVERVDGLASTEDYEKAYRDIVDFEQLLADDGHVIVKFWLHIGKAEQARRFKALEKDPLQKWRLQTDDWEHHWRYKDYLRAAEEMLEYTETEWAPWTIVSATDQHYTWWKVLTTITEAMIAGLRKRGVDTDAILRDLEEAEETAAPDEEAAWIEMETESAEHASAPVAAEQEATVRSETAISDSAQGGDRSESSAPAADPDLGPLSD